MSDPATSPAPGSTPRPDEGHPIIFAATVCAIVENRNLLAETGYSAADATLIGVSVVQEHDLDGHRIGTSLRLNYLSHGPRQTSYAVADSDILGAPEWFRPAAVEGLIERGEIKGELTAAAYRHWQTFRRTGRASADVVDIPN
jgi:hypothetical protein